MKTRRIDAICLILDTALHGERVPEEPLRAYLLRRRVTHIAIAEALGDIGQFPPNQAEVYGGLLHEALAQLAEDSQAVLGDREVAV